MTNAITLISTTTVGSGGAASIDFTSIPQTYTDLLLKVSSRINDTMTSVYCYFNSDTTSTTYSDKRIRGDGSATSSNSNQPARAFIAAGTDATASIFGNAEIYIPSYSLSSGYKSFISDGVTEHNGTTSFLVLHGGIKNSQPAITSISLVASSGSFVQYSTASLYGITNS